MEAHVLNKSFYLNQLIFYFEDKNLVTRHTLHTHIICSS